MARAALPVFLLGAHQEDIMACKKKGGGKKPYSSIPRWTAQSIVDDLEDDLYAWERLLESKEQNQSGGEQDG